MRILRVSPLTGEWNEKELPITAEQLYAWEHLGKHIQDAMPHISPADREFVMTGLTEADWEAMFDGEEDM